MSIYEAYFKFQGLVKDPIKDATNPHFKSKYVDLPGLMAVVKPALQEAGLMLIQNFDYNEGVHGLKTSIIDKKGDSLSSFVPINPDKDNVQGYGAAVTYLRRYSIESICGVCGTLDDDGNSASGSTRKADPLTAIFAKCQKAKSVDTEGWEEFKIEKGIPNGPTDVRALTPLGLKQLEKDLDKFLK